MEWVLRSPQIHSTFGNLGFVHGDGYHVNENCDAALEAILQNILKEDKYLRTYRRSISFGENIKKDLIPLLIHAKADSTVELLVKILVNLTIPVECLLSVEFISQSDFGRHTVFEINNLLTSTKTAFSDQRTTKIIVEFLKKNIDGDQKAKLLSPEQCTNISNCLLLLRNILHIPEDNSIQSPPYNGSNHGVQNQILWNLFSQSIDKILIKLMMMPDAANWGVTMVQLIALLYKDQHVVTLHKLLNLWLEASLSESSEDNESNTSPPDRGSEDSSPLLMSDPTSDSSDTGGSGKSNDEPTSISNGWDASSINNTSENGNQPYQRPSIAENKQTIDHDNDVSENTNDDTHKSDNDNTTTCSSGDTKSQGNSKENKHEKSFNCEKKTVRSENSDCGYGTQIENQESISTSSNEDELPAKKPIHQKPHGIKQRIGNKARTGVTLQDRKRKKIVKRGKANIINVQGLSHKTPTDDDISNVMKEFTVDFLLKGYNSLVQTLHNQILTNMQLEIDTSHFFWLITYFLKFATQIELDLEHVGSVLSYDIVSYLTAEGVNLCEQFELAIKLDGNDLKPSIRRLHLVVTAIREFVQAIEVYKKVNHMCKDDEEALLKLQMKMCETEELRSLLVLLLRHYDPKYHSKQYLQDLIVTNHILLMFLDSVMKLPDYNGSTNMLDHIRQFATPEIMYQYGLLLEDYVGNGEFVNDCIFTLMHHVGGELGCLITLFQPKILKTFTSIWKSEFEICDDWSDLIEYVINTFVKKPHAVQSTINFTVGTDSFEDDKASAELIGTPNNLTKQQAGGVDWRMLADTSHGDDTDDKWTEDELSSLSWNYMQCSALPDVVGEMIKLYKEDGIVKTRDSVIKELFKQNVICKDEFDKLLKRETEQSCKSVQVQKEGRDDEIGKLCDQLAQDGKSKFLDWVQKVLLDTCYAKLHVEKKKNNKFDDTRANKDSKLLKFELFKKKSDELPLISPVSYHSLLFDQSVPLVPWNCEQATICRDLKFLQLLHRLGFHMPVDSGKVFIRIPHFWTPDFLYDVAAKISSIDTSTLNFSLKDITISSDGESSRHKSVVLSSDLAQDVTIAGTLDNMYQVHKQKHLATMVNFTPMPGSSFNSESEETHKQNWMEVVQKSQEYKIILNIESDIVETENKVIMPMDGIRPTKKVCSAPKSVPEAQAGGTAAARPPLLSPNIMGAKQDSSSYTHLAESEYYNNSACETASVASDLTRMYVSDEDEKPEARIRPAIHDNTLDDRLSSDSDNAIAGKRPRVVFLPTF